MNLIKLCIFRIVNLYYSSNNLHSSVTSLLVRSDKLAAGSAAFLLYLAELRDPFVSFSGRLCSSRFLEISCSSFSTDAIRLSIEIEETNRNNTHTISPTISPDSTKKPSRHDGKLWAGLCSLSAPCSIRVKERKTNPAPWRSLEVQIKLTL